MNILLTGSTGFIGSTFLRHALAKGHSIVALVRPQKCGLRTLIQHEHLRVVPGTLADAPWNTIATLQPEVCVHCAWTTAPSIPYDSAEHFRCFEESRGFLEQVIRIGVSQIIGLGTCIEYRIGNEPLAEERTPIEPLRPYAQSKNQMRAWLEEASASKGFQFCWARIFYAYGVGEDPTRLCTSLIRRFRRNEPLVLKTPRSTKDYIYSEDVSAALLLLLEKKFRGAINLGTGVGVTIYELAETVAALLGKTGLVQTAPAEETDPLAYVVADSTRLRSLSWQPKYDLKRGLSEMIAAGE